MHLTDTRGYVPRQRPRVIERGSWKPGAAALQVACSRAGKSHCARAKCRLLDVQISLCQEAESTKPESNLQAQSCQADIQPTGHTTASAIGEAPKAKTKSRVGGIFEIRAVNVRGVREQWRHRSGHSHATEVLELEVKSYKQCRLDSDRYRYQSVLEFGASRCSEAAPRKAVFSD
jgi:hypothetical protein